MKKRIWIPLLIIVSVAIVIASQYPKLFLATGYGAKCMASGIFVAGREAESVKENDLDYSLVKYTTNKIDYIEKSVTTTFFGMAKQKAIYREGYGCFLVDESNTGNSLITNPISKYVSDKSWNQPWPDGDLASDTVFPEIDAAALNKAINEAFDVPGVKAKRTAAIFIAYKGKLVAEKYSKEQSITAETRLWGWSMNKSVINALAGVLVKKGKLSLQASAPVEEWLQDRRREITLNDLLHMSSGLKWTENYGDISEATTMLYRERNCYQSAIKAPFEKKPDAEWKYSSGTANILSGIIRKAINNDSEYFNFPYAEIFRKIGMNSMVLETDASGHFVGSSYGYATARDWAKFGLLILKDGIWKGDTILPKGWVDYSRTPAKAANGQYGAHFWLNRSGKLPDAPTDMVSCQGHRGQRIFILPSRDLVIVRLGFAEDKFDHNLFLKGILNAIKQQN